MLGAARARHSERGEWDAVASLLEVEVESAVGAPQAAAPLLAELGRVQLDELLDNRAASASFRKLLELKPNDAQVRAAIQDSETKRTRWQEMASTYLGEAQNAPDEIYKSSMLMRAAEMELRFRATLRTVRNHRTARTGGASRSQQRAGGPHAGTGLSANRALGRGGAGARRLADRSDTP